MRLFRNKANINVKNYRIPAAARPPRWDFRGAQRPRRARPLRLSCRIIGISGRASSVFLALFPILDALAFPVVCRSLLSYLLMASFFGSERRPLRACDRSPIGAVFSYRAGPKLTAGKRSREDEPGRIRAQYRKRGVSSPVRPRARLARRRACRSRFDPARRQGAERRARRGTDGVLLR